MHILVCALLNILVYTQKSDSICREDTSVYAHAYMETLFVYGNAYIEVLFHDVGGMVYEFPCQK